MNDEPTFLNVDDVLDLHAAQLELYGGGAGLRDRGLLESAVAQPQTSIGGAFVHDGLFAMAAAYLFHIVSNHPFVDGNKRTGLLAALVFLDLNGIAIEHPSQWVPRQEGNRGGAGTGRESEVGHRRATPHWVAIA